jgi:hypothetical protein
MKKLIAYSLYGNSPRYTINAIINAEICNELYPDWECRFYYDNSVPNKIIQKLKTYKNVNMIDMTNKSYDNFPTQHSPKMFWRFMAYDDSNVDVLIFRDTDSYPSIRERDAVNQWLETGKSLHLMREVQPGHHSRIMGGMWGLRKTGKLGSIVRESAKLGRQPTDQNYLTYSVYPLFENDRVVHDDSNCFGDKTHDWPTPRPHGDLYLGRTQGPPCEESGMVQRYNDLIVEMQ